MRARGPVRRARVSTASGSARSRSPMASCRKSERQFSRVSGDTNRASTVKPAECASRSTVRQVELLRPPSYAAIDECEVPATVASFCWVRPTARRRICNEFIPEYIQPRMFSPADLAVPRRIGRASQLCRRWPETLAPDIVRKQGDAWALLLWPQDGSATLNDLECKTIVPTHLPACVSVEREVFAGAGGEGAVCGAGVHRRHEPATSRA